jgi:hypothetical protein
MEAKRPRVIVDLPSHDYRWALRCAAAQMRMNVSEFILNLITPRLVELGQMREANEHADDSGKREGAA